MAAISWKTGTSGDWTTAADWSGGVVPGAADAVTIAASGTYTVTITSADAAQSLTLNAAGATVTDTGTLSLSSGISLTAGTFALNNGGTIAGGAIDIGSAGVFQANGGTLSGVAYHGTLGVTAGADLYLTGADTFAGTGNVGAGVINLTGANSTLDAVGALTLNNATLNFGGAGTTDTIYLDSGSASSTLLTLGSTLNLVQSAAASNVGINLYGRTGSVAGLQNSGTITANAAGGTFSVYGPNYGTFTNAGTIAISNGDTFSMTNLAHFANTGTVAVASGSVLQLGNTTGYGNISNAGGTIELYGTLTNTGATLSVPSGFQLSNGTILGGTVADATGLLSGNGTLSGVTYQGTLAVGANQDVYLAGTNSFAGAGGSGAGVINLTAANAALDAVGLATITGATLTIGAAGSTDTIYLDAGSASSTLLTLGSTLHVVQSTASSNAGINLYSRTGSAGGLLNNATITASASGGTFFVYGPSFGTFTNAGTIAISNGDTFSLTNLSQFTNTGTVTLASGGVLQLGGTITTAGYGKISNAGGTIELQGTLTNTGATFVPPSGFRLSNGTILGGRVVDATGVLGGSGTLSGVTYQGTLAVGANQDIYLAGTNSFIGSTGSGAGVINLTSANSAIDAVGLATINNATLTIGAAGTTDTIYLDAGSASSTLLTLGSSLNLVEGAASSSAGINLYSRTGSAGGLLNNGTITASASGGTFFVYGPGFGTFTNAGTIAISNGDTFSLTNLAHFTNTGTVKVASGGVLQLGGTITTAGYGKISNAGGTIELQGTLTNTGATFTPPSGFQLSNGTILGGTVADATGLLGGSGTLSGVAYQGTLSVRANQDIYLAGTNSFAGTGGSGAGVINLTAANAAIDGVGTATINGATLNIGAAGTTDTIYLDAGSASSTLLTLGSTLHVVESTASSNAGINIYSRTGNVGGLLNNGLITASASGGTFLVYGPGFGTFTNAGTIAISNGDTFSMTNLAHFANTGTVTLASGGVLQLGGTITTAGYGTVSNTGGTVLLQGTLTNTGATFTAPSGFQLSSGTILGGTVADATGLLGGNGTLSGVAYQGTLAVGANQDIFLAGPVSFAGASGTGSGVINVTGANSALDAVGLVTLDNATLNLGGAGTNDTLYLDAGSASSTLLTLGGGLNLVQSAASSGASINIYSRTGSAGSLQNNGTISAAASSGSFTIYGPGYGSFLNAGSIAVSNGDAFVANLGTFTNTGSIKVSGTSTASVQATTFTNLSSGTLTGGSYEADAGATLQIYTTAAVTTDAANIVLSGTGSLIEFYNTSTGSNTILESGLAAISAGGTLAVLAARNYVAPAAFTDAGFLQLGGGTFSSTGLTLASTGTLLGFGAVSGPVLDAGVVTANAGTLLVTGAVSGTGSLAVNAGATLELGGTAASGLTAGFVGQGGILKLDNATGFAAAIAGDAAGDVIDIANTTLTSASASGTVLTLHTATSTINLKLAAPLTGERFGVSSDGHGGTDVTAYRYAAATSHTPEPVAFGNVHVGAVASQALSITNSAAADGFSEKLDASMSGAASGATASGSFTGLAAGATQSTSLLVGLNTATSGAINGTATINLSTDGTGIDGGAPLSIGTQTVNVTGAVYAYAKPTFANSGTVALGNVHAGGSASGFATLTNAATANGFAEALDAGVASVAAGFSASGSVTQLAAGASDTTDLAVGFTSTKAGAISGKATLTLVSDGTGIDGLGTTSLAAGTLTITGAAYALAAATVPITSVNLGVVHVGSLAQKAITVTNSAATGGYSEALDAGFGAASGTATATGSFTGLAAGASNTTSLSVGVNTSTSGTVTGTDALNFLSDGTGIDGLGTTALASNTVSVTAIVDNYAVAAFQDAGGPAISGSGTSYTINLGSFAQASQVDVLSLGALNAATGLADLLRGTLTAGSGTNFVNSGFGTFSGLAAGQSETTQSVTFTTITPGTFSETILLSSTGTNASGYAGALPTETLTVTGTITALGAATYVLGAQPTTINGVAGGNVFQARNGSLNSRDSLTGGSGANVLQLIGGGTFDLGAPKVFANIPTVIASEGQAASATATATAQTVFMRDGSNENLTVLAGLPGYGNTNPEGITIYGGAGNDNFVLASGADVLVLATGTDTITLGGAANHVTAGGGTALISGTIADAGAAIIGSASSTTSLTLTTAGTATLNAADTHLTVTLGNASQLTLGALGFITASGAAGNDTIIAGGTSQTLIGGTQDVLNGSTLGTDTFSGTSAALNGDTLGNWTTGDVIDLTDMNSTTLHALSYSGGTLSVTDGTHSSAIVFSTSGLALTNFAVAGSDGHGGTLIDFHT